MGPQVKAFQCSAAVPSPVLKKTQTEGEGKKVNLTTGLIYGSHYINDCGHKIWKKEPVSKKLKNIYFKRNKHKVK